MTETKRVPIRLTDEDKAHIKNIRANLKYVRSNTAAIQIALKMLSEQIDIIRKNKK